MRATSLVPRQLNHQWSEAELNRRMGAGASGGNYHAGLATPNVCESSRVASEERTLTLNPEMHELQG